MDLLSILIIIYAACSAIIGLHFIVFAATREDKFTFARLLVGIFVTVFSPFFITYMIIGK